jgi:hypothetical protein
MTGQQLGGKIRNVLQSNFYPTEVPPIFTEDEQKDSPQDIVERANRSSMDLLEVTNEPIGYQNKDITEILD